MIVQKLLLLVVPLLLLVKAQDKDSVSRVGFPRIHHGYWPVVNIPLVSENVNTDKELTEVVTEENISYSPIAYDDVTTSSASKTENPEVTINSEYSSGPFVSPGIRVFTRKPLWSRRSSTSYFSRLSTVSPSITLNVNTLIPNTVVKNEPLTSESVTSNKEILDIITPTPQNKPDHILHTSSVPGAGSNRDFSSVQTVAITELPESTMYNQSENEAPESSTQSDIVSKETQTEYSTTLIPRPISNFPRPRPSYNAPATISTTTQEPTTQSVINFTTSPKAPLKPKPSYTVYQLYDYTCENVNGYYSVANQCEEYVECLNNIGYRNLCPEGLHFDSTKKWPAFPCAYPFEVECQRQSITTIEYVDVSSKRPEIVYVPETKYLEPVTVKPEETEYSTPATTGRPTWKLLWSTQTSTSHFSQFSTAIPTTTVGPKTLESQFPISIRATYAIFQPQETMEPYTTNLFINEPKTSELVTTQSNYLLDDVTSTYTQTEDPEPSTQPNESLDDVSNETPTEGSSTPIILQTIPDISTPNIISSSSTSHLDTGTTEETNEVSTYETTFEPDLDERPVQTTTITNQPTNPQRPNWNFPSGPSDNVISTTSETTTKLTPITQPIINLTTRPTTPQKLIPFYAVNQLNDYTCRNVNGYYSVKDQCDEYVECQNNKAYRSLCPDGLHFDPEAKWPAYPCAFPSEVKCQSQSIIQQAQPTDQCPHRYGIFPAPNGDCGHFIMCQEGLATSMSCPSGLAFNSISSICDWPVNVPDCNLNIFQDFTCPPDDYARVSTLITYHKYKNSCKEYIACQEGRPRLLSCDAGLSFDEKTNQCVKSELIDLCQNYI